MVRRKNDLRKNAIRTIDSKSTCKVAKNQGNLVEEAGIEKNQQMSTLNNDHCILFRR